MVRLNIFSIPSEELPAVKAKLLASGMDMIQTVDQDGWIGSFYYSLDPPAGVVSWAAEYAAYFEEVGMPQNRNYYAAFVFECEGSCYVLSYGKTHFYLRAYCDFDFGIELAKRVSDEYQIKQTSARRFQGRQTKGIRSFADRTRLDVQSGESFDYLQAGIIESERETFGKTGRFGTSAMLTPDIGRADLGWFLNTIEAKLKQEPAFVLPRTVMVTDPLEIERYDGLLVAELLAPVGTTDFTHNTYDLYGVDFVFPNSGSFKLYRRGYPDLAVEDLTMKDLKQYIASNKIPKADILDIKVRHQPDDRAAFSEPIKKAVDFIADGERVVLTAGRWMRFNQDYLDFLDDYVRHIPVEEVEPQFLDIATAQTEGELNTSAEISDAGYSVADKDFSIFQTRSGTPVEAWDLRRGDTVYAVKFGTPQKLNYVVDQAMNVLELIGNEATVRQVPKFKRYCLWVGYRAKERPGNLADSGSIIFKQKLEAWARRCRELNIEPAVKISRKLKPGVEV